MIRINKQLSKQSNFDYNCKVSINYEHQFYETKFKSNWKTFLKTEADFKFVNNEQFLKRFKNNHQSYIKI